MMFSLISMLIRLFYISVFKPESTINKLFMQWIGS